MQGMYCSFQKHQLPQLFVNSPRLILKLKTQTSLHDAINNYINGGYSFRKKSTYLGKVMIIDRHHCSPGLRINFLLCLYWICLDLALDCQLLYFTRHIAKFFKFIVVIKMCLPPTLVYTKMEMSLKSVPLVRNIFGRPQRETSVLQQYFQCVFSVRSLVSIVMP
jgi:hypothetical protein